MYPSTQDSTTAKLSKRHLSERLQGFTIVELLIVIVVIAILAAISVVAYIGIQKQATESVVKSEVSQIQRAVEAAKITEEGYPTGFPDNVRSIINGNDSVVYSYFQRDDGSGFCVDAYSTAHHDATYFTTSSNNSVQSGVCSENSYRPPGYVPPPTALACFRMNGSIVAEYYDTENNTAGASACPLDVTIPNSATSIAGAVFQGNQLTSVAIPGSVTSISSYAFQGNRLTSLIIPDSVTSIANSAFRDNQLTSIVIPNSVTLVHNYAFRGNRLTSVTIGSSVTSIGNYSFQDNQLTSITIPDSVASIGNYAFQKNQLTSVELPAHTTYTTSGVDSSFDSNVTITRR